MIQTAVNNDCDMDGQNDVYFLYEIWRVQQLEAAWCGALYIRSTIAT